MSQDALAAWIVAAFLALYILGCIALGGLPGRSLTLIIRRNETPRLFWVLIGLFGAALVGLIFVAVYFTLPPLPSS